MAKTETYIKEWNAVTYLRDFINCNLILNNKEQAVWNYLQQQNKIYGEYYQPKPTRGNIAKMYRACKRCGEIKTIEEFANTKTYICLECRAKERVICKN